MTPFGPFPTEKAVIVNDDLYWPCWDVRSVLHLINVPNGSSLQTGLIYVLYILFYHSIRLHSPLLMKLETFMDCQYHTMAQSRPLSILSAANQQPLRSVRQQNIPVVL